MQRNQIITHSFTFGEFETQAIWAVLNGLDFDHIRTALHTSSTEIDSEYWNDQIAFGKVMEIQKFLDGFFFNGNADIDDSKVIE